MRGLAKAAAALALALAIGASAGARVEAPRAQDRAAVPAPGAVAGDLGGAIPAGSSAAPEEARRRLWVFFRERDPIASKSLLESPDRWVGPRARARRALRGRAGLVSAADLPVDAACRDAVLATGARVVTASRWLHAVSVVATPAESARIAALPCVASLRPVARRASIEPPPAGEGRSPSEGRTPLAPLAPHALDYGLSAAQLDQIAVPAVHDLGYSGAGIVVGLLDTGFERTHPAFAGTCILAERDFVEDDGVTSGGGASVSGHGTSVLSTIASYAPGELIGVAYGASFVLAKTEITSAEIPAEEDLWVAGLEWEESLGVDVVSSSLGYLAFPNEDFYTYEQMDGATAVTTRAAAMAVERGVVVVNAMGNERGTSWRYLIAPADAESVISVGAVDVNGAPTGFTGVGPTADGRLKPDVMALGLGTYVAGGSRFTHSNGTSFAAPLVSGIAALLLEARPQTTPAELQEVLRQTATQSATPDTISGYGVARALDALNALPGPSASPARMARSVSVPASSIHTTAGGVFAPTLGPLDWTFNLPASGHVVAVLHDATGRAVTTMLDQHETASCAAPLPWDGRDEDGENVPAGVYFVRLVTPAGASSSRMILVR